MICLYKNKQGTEILLAYGAGTLDAERAGLLHQHASECSDCRALMAAQKNLWNVLDEVGVPDVSADFDARLYARIAAEDAQVSWKRSLQTWLHGFAPGGISWKPLAVGAAAAAVLSVGLVVRIPQVAEAFGEEGGAAPGAFQVELLEGLGIDTTLGTPVRSEAMDAEQVEVSLEDLEILTPPVASAGRM